jgi:zinc resistance-associated protein
MKKALVIIGSLMVVAIMAGSGFAWGPGHGRGFGSGGDCPGFSGRGAGANLSQEQRDSLAALRQKFIDETYESRSALSQKHQEIRLLMETSSPDRNKLQDLSEEMLDLQKQVRDKMIDFQLEAKKISPELMMGSGFGRGWGKDGNRGGKKGCRGYNQGDQGNRAGCPGQGQGPKAPCYNN